MESPPEVNGKVHFTDYVVEDASYRSFCDEVLGYDIVERYDPVA